jgi:hypothetical protein
VDGTSVTATERGHSQDGPSRWRGPESPATSVSSLLLPAIHVSVPFPSSDGHDTDLTRAHTASPILLRQRRVLTFRGLYFRVLFSHCLKCLIEDEHYPRSQSLISSVRPTPGVPLPFAHDTKYEGFGGFPGPVDIINKVLKRAAPSAYLRLQRSMTVPYTTTLEGRSEPWLNFDGLVVGRNSDFRTEPLTSVQIEEIGGTEYKALGLLSWLVPAVCFSF